MQPTIILWIAAAAYIVFQQFQPRPMNARLLVAIPLVLAFWGLRSVGQLGDLESTLFFALNAAVVVALGMWRGSSVRVWTEAGQAFQQGTLTTLGLWVVSIVVRLALVAAGHLVGTSLAESMGELPLLLALTLGAQNLVIWMRATASAPRFARSM